MEQGFTDVDLETMATTASAYEVAQSKGRDALRSTLLDTASRLLAAEGAAALTVRRIAAEVGCSTTVLYTMFGSKNGIAEALFREGFERFRRRLESLPPEPDRLAHVYQLARAYRENALADPNYYRVMFSQAIPGFIPSTEALAAADAGLEILVDAAGACIEAGIFAAADPREVAAVLWAAAHGVVSLELSGHLGSDPAERCFETATRAATNWFLAGSNRRTGS